MEKFLLWSGAILKWLHSVRVLHLQNLQHLSQLPYWPVLNQRHQVVLPQLQVEQRPLMPLVVILQLVTLLLPLATLEQGSMVMLYRPTMDLHSRRPTAKPCKGMAFLLEEVRAQFLPHMVILSHLAVEVLLLPRQLLAEVAWLN